MLFGLGMWESSLPLQRSKKWRSYACRTSIGDAQPQVDVPLGVVEKNRDALGLADGKVEALWHTGVEPLDMVVLW